MATVYGVNKTKLLSPTGSNILDAGLNKAKVCSMYDEYEASSLASGSVIEVGDKLPTGAIVTNIDVIFDALGASSTIDVGDAGDADRYIDGVSTASAGITSFPNSTCIDGGGYQITGSSDNQIQITTGGASITGTIKVLIKYAI